MPQRHFICQNRKTLKFDRISVQCFWFGRVTLGYFPVNFHVLRGIHVHPPPSTPHMFGPIEQNDGWTHSAWTLITRVLLLIVSNTCSSWTLMSRVSKWNHQTEQKQAKVTNVKRIRLARCYGDVRRYQSSHRVCCVFFFLFFFRL